ncbi:hypothetical protein FDX05_01920 [Citrobacter sp. wls715]|uniref:Uncharacterized protein n=1 Tax=Citrobacter pasteurii TaxID=1563222 RepID=A0A6N6JX74_9ENTR|nr:hypothetical protein DXF85_23755 [Citrobacter pasteurii]TKU66539.1 hypothetical protein FDX05_01920 [Citrobacter sp. wls715]
MKTGLRSCNEKKQQLFSPFCPVPSLPEVVSTHKIIRVAGKRQTSDKFVRNEFFQPKDVPHFIPMGLLK